MKTISVIDDNHHPHDFRADAYEVDEGTLKIYKKTKTVAVFQAHAWRSLSIMSKKTT